MLEILATPSLQAWQNCRSAVTTNDACPGDAIGFCTAPGLYGGKGLDPDTDLFLDFWDSQPSGRDVSTSQAIAADPYDQLSWYEQNTWRFGNGHIALPNGPQRYKANTIPANIRANLQVDCTMLYNTPAATPEGVPGASADIVVNTAQAIGCEYPNNVMEVTTSIPAVAFGINQGTLQLAINQSQPDWGAGSRYGYLNFTMENIDDMAQLVIVTPGGCCMVSPDFDCSVVSYVQSSLGNQTVLIQSGESITLQFYVVSDVKGDGYCEVSVSHLYYDATRSGNFSVFNFVDQLHFSTPPGLPVSFSVTFDMFFPDIDRSYYFAHGGVQSTNYSGLLAFSNV